MNRTKSVNKFIRLKAKTRESRGKQMPPLKNVSGSYGEAVIRWKKKQQQQQIHRTEGKGKGPKAKHLGRVELHEQRKVRVPSAKIALLLSKAFQEPSHHI